MPTSIVDAFGNAMEVCSISTSLKATLPKLSWLSEAQWMADIKKGAFYTLRQKIDNGELIKNTVIGRTPLGHKLVYKGDGYMELSKTGVQSKGMWKLEGFEDTKMFSNNDWDFGPNMAQMAKQAQVIVDTPAKLSKWIKSDPEAMDLDLDDVVGSVKWPTGKTYDLKFDGLDSFGNPKYKMNGDYGTELLDYDGLEWYAKNDGYKIEYKVGQTPPVPAAAKLPPVSSTSNSVGLLTNEEAATMFVKVKDQLALEKGINIKGASGKLDELVYKTIADQTGYTPAEMLAKVEAYKGTGKKLSALKKKVLPKSGDATKAPTLKAVDKATEAIKKEELKPDEVILVWDDEAVAKAYIKAKDNVVANNGKGWTLYTKSPDLDNAILKKMQEELGPIKQEVANTAVANYIANNKKLSVLKKQMIKNGEMKAEADTLKKKGKFDGDEPGDSDDFQNAAPEDAKPAPDTTGGGVGKTTENPLKIGPKQTLDEEMKAQVKDQWESANLPLSSSGQHIYNTAKVMAKQYGLGDDVLPILRWVDEYKAQKFGVKNGQLYEKKVLEHLANPVPSGYVPPTSSAFTGGHMESKVFGEDPTDSSLFKHISPSEMGELHVNQMGRPTSGQQSALRTYSGSTYHEINGHLRQGKPISGNTYAKSIQDSMRPMPESVVARRGTSLNALGVHSPEELASSIGKTFKEPGFSSTAVGGSGQFGGSVNLIIQVPKGAKAVWLKPYSNIPGENELLLEAGTRFKILKVEQKTSPYGGVTNVVTVRVEVP